MKNMKKFASVLLALVMALALTVPALADPVEGEEETTETANIIVPTMNDHKFVAYQIFKGTQVDGNNTQLADIEWGNGIKPSEFLTALAASKAFTDNPFEADMTAAQVAKALSDQGTQFNNEAAIEFARIASLYIEKNNGSTPKTGTGEITGLALGYYLIVDITDLTGTDTVRNASLLQLTSDVQVTVKVDVPQVDKKVKENKNGNFGEVADYSIGDVVPFEFISAVPNMTQYATYKYIFHDKMDKGLTFNSSSVKVTIGGTEVSGYTVATSGFDDDDECTFEVRFDDLKKVSAAKEGAEVVITFNATLNSNAVVGPTGNGNTVHLEYSNNPTPTGTGEPDTGKTPDDKVLVFTYELDTNKYNENNVALDDAHFVLYREVNDDDEKTETTGTYKWATVTNGKLTGWVDSEENATDLVSEDGKFAVEGLDAGVYYLKETKAPDGYNTPADPWKVTISRTLNQEEEKYTELKVILEKNDTKEAENAELVNDDNKQTGAVQIGIQNQSGAVMPETGGIGTTIFYTLGGLLVVAAGIMLVTKRRMQAHQA